MKRKPKSYKTGSQPGNVIKIFCESMHSTLCGSPNISLTRRSLPSPERETKFSKVWIQRKQKSYKTESPGSVTVYNQSSKYLVNLCGSANMSLTRREIESFRADRIIYTETCLQIQTCSKGSSDHHRNLRSCDYYCSRTSTIMFGLLIVQVHSCNILIKCTNYCYTLGMNHILILEVVRQ